MNKDKLVKCGGYFFTYLLLFISLLYVAAPWINTTKEIICDSLYSVDNVDIQNPSYRTIFQTHDDNVSNKFNNYLELYHAFYQKFVGKTPNILEIGVQNGGSLQIASKYFINGNIYGVDIDPRVCTMELGKNIKTYCFDVNDQDKFHEHFANMKFDVIADDGSHINSDIITSFKTLFPKVSPGGVYLVEDLHTSYWRQYKGGYLKKDTAVEFFKGFIDLANAYHITEEDEFIKKLSENDRYVMEWLESITFYDSVAVIKKLNRARQKPYSRILAGKHQPVVTLQ